MGAWEVWDFFCMIRILFLCKDILLLLPYIILPCRITAAYVSQVHTPGGVAQLR